MSDSNRTPWVAAIGGGIVGAALAAGAMYIAAPKLVRDVMVTHPKIMVEAGQALRVQQYAEALTPIRAAVERPFGSSWRGAAKPDVTLVYFFDYACGYCRISNPDIDRLLKEDKGLRVVYRELPILGPDSLAAARVSLAASKAGRFGQFHDTLYAAGRPSPETVALAAKAAGVPPEPTEDPAQEAELRSNSMLASQLGATGTPLFVIGNQVFNSAVGYDELKKAVVTARDAN